VTNYREHELSARVIEGRTEDNKALTGRYHARLEDLLTRSNAYFQPPKILQS
jgi:hypothetical protein